MSASHNPENKFDKLRQQAEELVRQSRPMAGPPPDDILELIYELKIHQAELEIENEELKRAQQELADLHRQYERLYEFAPCGYLTLNPKGIITRINLNGVSLINSSKHLLLKSALSNYIAPAWQDAFFNARIDSGRTGEKQRIELQLKRKKEPLPWVRVDITADRDESGAVLRWLVILVDISREKAVGAQISKLNEILEQRIAERTVELEDRLSQLQRLTLQLTQAEDRERKRFASIFHDDFQQDAAYIKMEIARLSRQVDTLIKQQLDQLGKFTSRFIERMRHFSHSIQPPALHRGGLLPALKVLANEMQKHHGLAVTLQLQREAEPAHRTLASLLYRSVRELLFNVVKHAGVNAAVVEVTRKETEIRISVADDGKGFDYPAVRNGGGDDVGYGLFSIEERMSFLGGMMQIRSMPGKGSRIDLSVPADIDTSPFVPFSSATPPFRQEALALAPAEMVADVDDGEPVRILLVEDHKLMRKGLAELLHGTNELTIVGEAVDGIQAVKLADRLGPQLILMDVTMPKLDGIEATARIIRKHPHIRIIGLSMHNDDDTRQKMLNAGAMAFLSKTDSPDKLLKTILRICRGKKRTKRKTGSKEK